MASLADRARVKLQPALYADAENGGILDAYLSGLVLPLQEVEDYAADSDAGPGWSVVLDLTRAPDKLMPWLSQFVGVDATVPIGQTPVQLRDAIAFRPNWKRGTPAALAAALQPLLSGNKSVLIRERDTSPYHFSIFTYEAETPIAEWPTTNIIPDPSFEAGVAAGFVNSDATLSSLVRSPDSYMHGAYSMKGITSTNPTAYMYNPNGFSPIVPGEVWSASGYMLSSRACSIQLAMQYQNAAGTVNTGIIYSPMIAIPAWVFIRVGITSTAPAGTDKVRPIFYWYGMSPGDQVYLDAVQLEKKNAVTPFVVGSRAAGTVTMDAAIRANKPAGLQFTYDVRAGQDYAALLANHPLYSNVFADYATYQGVVDDRPGT